MATPTTIDLDTELSAVNSILGSIGQSPVTNLNFTNPEIEFIYNLLKESNVEVQSEGWVYNREDHYPFTPDSNGHIAIPANILRMDVCEEEVYRTSDVVKRDGKLYNKVEHTFEFKEPIDMNVVWLFPFEDLPQPFKRLIVAKASTRAAVQLVSNPTLVQLLGQQEAYTRAIVLEYECNQGDHNFLGMGHDQGYRAYEPFRGLRR
jgi:hypothetical protein|tara:strand:- start:582 stop:1196 length:615 start_codon:yes stop_codon:yes gene_type:complete